MKRLDASSIFLWLFCLLVLLFLILPILVIIPLSFNSSRYLSFPPEEISFRWYREYFSNTEWIAATLRSFIVASATTVVSTLLGVLASFPLARKIFILKNFFQILLLAPMFIPLIVIAVGIFFMFSQLNLLDTTIGLIIAHTILATPLVILSVTASLKNYDETFEFVAMNLGANRLRTFYTVTLPLMKPGIITGAIFAFITSWDEIVLAIFICGTNAITLPKQMWDGIRFAMDPTITAVSTMLIVVTLCLVAIGEFVRQRIR